MSSSLLPPPREQLCNRSCSNKTHTRPLFTEDTVCQLIKREETSGFHNFAVMNTCLSFLLRNVIPDNMATDCDDRAHIGPAHVDNKIVHEVLRAATGDTLMHASARAEVVQTQSPIPAPRGRVRDNADSSVRASSVLFCNQQVRRISRKSPSRRRMAARWTSACRSRHMV